MHNAMDFRPDPEQALRLTQREIHLILRPQPMLDDLCASKRVHDPMLCSESNEDSPTEKNSRFPGNGDGERIGVPIRQAEGD